MTRKLEGKGVMYRQDFLDSRDSLFSPADQSRDTFLLASQEGLIDGSEKEALLSGAPLKVMHVAPGHWAGHMRIYHRECMALVEAGYSVELIAHTLGQEELDPRIRLHTDDSGFPSHLCDSRFEARLR